uniref:Uncharacterized protein n=1 Tax=Babesia bovis TaxID=5865 RepID=S6B7L6_BABBO|nr:hypothetical protein [Babesia bovis]
MSTENRKLSHHDQPQRPCPASPDASRLLEYARFAAIISPCGKSQKPKISRHRDENELHGPH